MLFINRGSFQERVSDRLEGQRHEQAMQLYQTQADNLEQWLARMRVAVNGVLQLKPEEETEMEDQLTECQVRAPPAVRSLHSIKAHIYTLHILINMSEFMNMSI